MIVKFNDEALRDLEEIGDFISRDNPRRAATFVDELIDRCGELGDFPQAFPFVSRYARRGIRKLAYRRYLIFYRVIDQRVEIIHVLHGARDYSSILDR